MGREEPRGQTGFGRGTIVSITRLPGLNQPMGRAIGLGELTARLEVGNPIQIRLEAGHGGRVLAATTCLRIEVVGPDTVRIATRNHRYELRRVAGSLSGRPAPSRPAPPTSASTPNDDTADRTQVLSVLDWPEPAPGRFETGARVRLAQQRDGETRGLGIAVLLTDLVAGECASFGIEGRVLATSAVRSVIQRDESTVEIATGNSTYRLELVRGDEKVGKEEGHV
jgi:hypothetical protein